MQGVPVPPIVSKGAGNVDANTIRTVNATDSQVAVTAAMGDPRILSPNGLGVTVSDSQVAEAQSQDQPIFVAITGDPAGDFAGVNILEQLVDDATGLALSTRVINPPKLDPNGMLITSDCVGPIKIWGQGTGTPQAYFIDTMGYASLHVSAFGANATCNWQNELNANGVQPVNFTPSSGSVNAAIPINTCVVFPVAARWLRITPGVAANSYVIVYLRRDPMSPGLGTNLSTVLGSNVATAASGVLAVGGNIAAGAAPTANPNLMAGVDSGEVRLAAALTGLVPVPLTRRFLTDTLGRQRLTNEVAPVSQFTNVPALNVQDTTQFEGQSVVDLLAQILTELKVMNLQIQAMPAVLNSGGVLLDDPADLRSDSTLFN